MRFRVCKARILIGSAMWLPKLPTLMLEIEGRRKMEVLEASRIVVAGGKAR